MRAGLAAEALAQLTWGDKWPNYGISRRNSIHVMAAKRLELC